MFRLKEAHEPATRAAATCFASHVVVPHRQLSWNSRRSRLRTPDARVPTLGICRCLPNLPNGRCTKSRPLFFFLFPTFQVRCIASLRLTFCSNSSVTPLHFLFNLSLSRPPTSPLFYLFCHCRHICSVRRLVFSSAGRLSSLCLLLPSPSPFFFPEASTLH